MLAFTMSSMQATFYSLANYFMLKLSVFKKTVETGNLFTYAVYQ